MNSSDMVRKGRQAKGDRHHFRQRPDCHPVGSSIGTAKLNEDSVRKIKGRLSAGERKSEIAKEYSVSYDTILGIEKGKSWKHVEVRQQADNC